MTGPQRALVEDTTYMQVFMLGTMGLLVMLPESVTQWDLDALDEKSLSERWKEHVRAGPVMDEDDMFINYIGHPVSGAWYYTMARNDGMDPFESFLYSTFVSTFIWEYGYEAFAEIPSIQDLIATPIIGSLLGEYMYYLEGELDENRGKIWGYQWLGSTSYFLIDPIGNIASGLSGFFDVDVTLRFETYQPNYSRQQTTYNYMLDKPTGQYSRWDYGVILSLEF